MTEHIHQKDASETSQLRALISSIQEDKVPKGYVLAASFAPIQTAAIPMTSVEVTVMGGYVVAVARNTYQSPLLHVFASAADFVQRLSILREASIANE